MLKHAAPRLLVILPYEGGDGTAFSSATILAHHPVHRRTDIPALYREALLFLVLA
jgi:hypothetical protein